MKILQMIAVAAVVIGTASPASAERVCLDQRVWGSSPRGPIPWTTKQAARDSARGNWQLRVQEHGHATFADWAKARNKSVQCNRLPNGFGGYNHSCTYKGRPCRDE